MRYHSRSTSPVEWSNPPSHTFGLFPYGGRFQDYPLVQAECNYRLVDVYLSAVLKHTFKSHSKQQAHVSYVFPLPPDASVHDFTAHIDDRIVKGVVKEKKQARAEYDRAIAQNRQAALLQQENIEVFKLMLGNVRPGQTVTVHISFVSLTSHEGVNDTLRLTFPTSIAPRYGSPPGDGSAASGGPASSSTMLFGLSVEVGANITSISSPSHPITSQLGSSTREPGETFDPTTAHISLSSTTFLQDDIVVIISCKNLDRQRCVVESYISEDGKTVTDAYALTLVPRFKLPSLQQSEFLFLVDCSGSMAGGKIRAVRGALQIMLKSLPNKGTTFNIVRFGSSQDKLWYQAVPYTAENVQIASRYVNHMGADLGGTEMELGLKAAFSSRTSAARPTSVFVLTDGECWELDAVQAVISKHVNLSRGTVSPLRVFCMGIGNAVSKAMCEGISRAGNGHAVYVGEDENLGQKLINLIRAAHTPPVEDLTVDWGIPEVNLGDEGFELLGIEQPTQQLSLFDDAQNEHEDRNEEMIGPSPSTFWQHPPQGLIPSIQPGSRYSFYSILNRESEKQGLSEKVQLKGSVLGQPIHLEVPVASVHRTAGMSGLSGKLIHLIAARAMIQDFEDQGSKEQVLNMALTYGLISSQTSFVAVDLSEGEPEPVPLGMDHRQVLRPSRRRSRSPHPADYARHNRSHYEDDRSTGIQAPVIIMGSSRCRLDSGSRSRSPSPYSVDTQPPIIMTQASRHRSRSHSRSRTFSGASPPVIMARASRPSGRGHTSHSRHTYDDQPTIIMADRERSRSRSRSVSLARYGPIPTQPIITGQSSHYFVPDQPRRRSCSYSPSRAVPHSSVVMSAPGSPRAFVMPQSFAPPAPVMNQASIIMTAPSRRSRSRSPRHHQSSAGIQPAIIMSSGPRSRSRSRCRDRDYARISAPTGTGAPFIATASSRPLQLRSTSPQCRAPSQQLSTTGGSRRSRSRSPVKHRRRHAEPPRGAVIAVKPSASGGQMGDTKASKRQSIGSKLGSTISRVFRRKNTNGDVGGAMANPVEPTVTSEGGVAGERDPDDGPNNPTYQSPVMVDRWRRRASVSSWASDQLHTTPISVPAPSNNNLECNVASIAFAQAFDGSFNPSSELVHLLTGQDALPDLPPTIQLLKIDESTKKTLWCSMLALVFLDTHFADEKDTWVMFVDKTRDWMEETLDQAGLDWPRIDATLQEVRDAGANIIRAQSEYKE